MSRPTPPSHATTSDRRPEATATVNGQAGPSIDPPSDPNQDNLGGWAHQVRLPVSWGLQMLMLALHAGEELQRAQLDGWHLALKRREDAQQRLLSCRDTAEMASLQADLLRFDTANMTHLSQRCVDTLVHFNTDLARLATEVIDGSRHQWVKSAFQSFQSGMRTGIRPLDEIFNAPVLQELARRTASAPSAKQ